MQKNWVRIVSTVMTAAVMIMIFAFSMEPAEKSDATSGQIAERAADIFRPEWRNFELKRKKSFFNEVQHVVRKCAHYTEFTLLGFSLRFCLESWFGKKRNRGDFFRFADAVTEKKRSAGISAGIYWISPVSWLGGTLYALLDEIHQKLVDGRSGQGTDVLLDSAGVLTGVLFFLLLLHLTVRRGLKKCAPT